MRRTLGYHIVVSGYGLWLPGDARGSWSAAWDDQLRLVEPHMLHAGDVVRLRMSQERAKHPPVRLSNPMIDAVVTTIESCASESDWSVAAASVESTYTHLLLTYTVRDIDQTVKWIKDRTTKAIHRDTAHRGPVWCKGKWCVFVYDEEAWRAVMEYIQRYNVRRGLPARPYRFISPP